jgi:phosphomevalonate kinase
MSEHHASAIERILHRIEEHLEDWRKRDAALQAAADESRSRLWAEAAEREKLLAEAVAEEEARRSSLEEITRQHRVVFVVHSEEIARMLETFARERDHLVNLVPGRGSYGEETVIKDS